MIKGKDLRTSERKNMVRKNMVNTISFPFLEFSTLRLKVKAKIIQHCLMWFQMSVKEIFKAITSKYCTPGHLS